MCRVIYVGLALFWRFCWMLAWMDVEDYYFVVVIVLFREGWY
jgi:hypothetical protein